MTTSTADTSQQKPKRPGPIRTEAVLPFVIITALVWAYFHFFFDGHLRRGLEYGGTQAVGAEVNVGAVQSSFWGARLLIRDIQITDASLPSHNLVRIGEVRWVMLWDALLRGKIVIDEAAITGIQLASPRAHPGRVLPPPPKEESTGPGYGETVLANVQKEFSANIFGDLAALAQGADAGEQFSGLTEQLKSETRLTELKAELAAKEQAWNERLAALPTTAQTAALSERLRKVKRDKFKDIKEIQASVKELEAIRDDFNAQTAKIREAGSAFGSDTAATRAAYGELEQLIEQDIRDIQAHFRLPALNARSMSNVLFGPDLYGKVMNARDYMEKARAYLPPKRSAEEQATRQLQPTTRAAGRDYAFGRPNSYPLFWLKKAQITSTSSSGNRNADLTGQITDVTSDPVAVGKPLLASLTGSFPQQGWYDTRTELIIDHTTADPVERLVFTIGRYALNDYPLVTSDSASLGFAKSSGRSQFSAELRGQQVDIRLDNDFTGVEYAVGGNSAMVREILTAATADADHVTVNARISGTWSNIDWKLKTNLADLLEDGFRRHLQAKIEAAQARARAMVDERIAAEKRKLNEQLAATEARLKAQVAAKQAELEKLRAELDKAKADLEARKKELEKQLEQKLKQEGGKLLDSLKQRL